jgi:hypothetical protein
MMKEFLVTLKIYQEMVLNKSILPLIQLVTSTMICVQPCGLSISLGTSKMSLNLVPILPQHAYSQAKLQMELQLQ